MLMTKMQTEIETFLEARKEDGASFDWSPEDTATTFKWICRSFYKKYLSLIEIE